MGKVSLLHIFGIFAKMGLFTFGGGYAMLPILQSEIVEKRHWITEEELLNYYSIGQCTPGIIAVNATSFIGYKMRGLLGLISATVGLILPPITIILLIAMLLRQYMDNQYLQWAFGGIRICVLALIMNTVWNMWQSSVKNVYGYIVFGIALILLFAFKISAVALVILAAIGSLLSSLWRR